MSRAGTAPASKPLAFETEVALQEALTELDLGLSGGARFPHTLMRREVPVGGCIPDLVCVRFAQPPSPELWPARRSFRHAFVVSLLRRWRHLHLDTIATKAFEKPERMEPVLEDLVSTSALVQADSGAYALSDEMAQVEAQVVAVEAKLTRWREALDQANNYRSFADVVIVAMDAIGAPSEPEVLKEFNRLGVGLCSVEPGSVEWMVGPRESSGRSRPDWEYLVSTAAAPRPQTPWSLR